MSKVKVGGLEDFDRELVDLRLGIFRVQIGQIELNLVVLPDLLDARRQLEPDTILFDSLVHKLNPFLRLICIHTFQFPPRDVVRVELPINWDTHSVDAAFVLRLMLKVGAQWVYLNSVFEFEDLGRLILEFDIVVERDVDVKVLIVGSDGALDRAIHIDISSDVDGVGFPEQVTVLWSEREASDRLVEVNERREGVPAFELALEYRLVADGVTFDQRKCVVDIVAAVRSLRIVRVVQDELLTKFELRALQLLLPHFERGHYADYREGTT